MDKRYSHLLFIDRLNYTQLQSKDLNIDDIANIYTSEFVRDQAVEASKSKFSSLTKAYLLEMNNRLNKAIFDENIFNDSLRYDSKISTQEVSYTNHAVDSFLTGSSEDIGLNEVPVSSDSGTDPKKYYEIIPLVGNNSSHLLVVVEEGFFTNLTRCKSDFLNFTLASLSFQYKSGSVMEFLMRLYLSVKVSDGQFDLIKLRFNNPR
jgi:hypothetical protein